MIPHGTDSHLKLESLLLFPQQHSASSPAPVHSHSAATVINTCSIMCVCSGHLWGHLWPCGADPRPVGDRVLPEAAVLLCQHHRWHQVRPSVSCLFPYGLLWTSVRSGQLGPSVWLGFSISPISEWSSGLSWELLQYLDPKANKKKTEPEVEMFSAAAPPQSSLTSKNDHTWAGTSVITCVLLFLGLFRTVQLLWHQLRVSVLVLKERLLQSLQDSNGNFTRQTDILQAFSEDQHQVEPTHTCTHCSAFWSQVSSTNSLSWVIK